MTDGAWREAAVVPGLAGLGAALGILAKVADESAHTWAGDLGTYPAAWVLALAVIARLAPTITRAAARATSFFLAMSLAYFVWSWFALSFGVDRYPVLWLGLSFTAVPSLAAVIHWAAVRRGAFPGLLIATVAALAVADGLLWQLWWAWVLREAPDGFPLRPFQALVGVAVALAVIVFLPRYVRTRVWALALVVPTALLAGGVVDRVMGGLLRLV